MYFYDDFVNRLLEFSTDIKNNNKFGLSLRKKLFWIFLGSSIFAIGIKGAYDSFYNEKYIFMILFIILGIYGIFAMFYYILTYKIEINLDNGKIIYNKTEIDIDNIDNVVLKIMFYKKKVITGIQVVTKDNKAYVFPLIMNKKTYFVYIFKEKFKEKFKIEKPQ